MKTGVRMPEIPTNEMTKKQLLRYIAQEVGERMSELSQHVETQLAQTEAERAGRVAAEEALRQAQEALQAAQQLADALTANDADQEAQIAEFRTRAETAEGEVAAAIERLKSDDPAPVEDPAPVDPEVPADTEPVDGFDPANPGA